MKENLDDIGEIINENGSDDENEIKTNSNINQDNKNKDNFQDQRNEKLNSNINHRTSIKKRNFQEIDGFQIVLDNPEEYKKMIIDQAKKKIWRAIKKIKEADDVNRLIYDPTAAKKYIINPEKNRIIPFFNFLIYILLYVDIVISPFEYFVYCENKFKLKRIALFDSVFLIEIILTMFTSYYDTVDKAYVTDLKKIFKNYLWNGFIPNAIYVFPFYLFDDSLEIVRLLKIYRYPKISNKTKTILSRIISLFLKNSLILSHIIRVTTLFLSLCYILHICACVYCFLGLKYANSWIWQYPELVDSSNIIDIYVSSYYFITETFSSTGYGDLTPINSAEILFIMFCQILNCGLYAYLLSNILDILLNKDNSNDNKYRASQVQFEQWITYYMSRLPSSSKKSNLHRHRIWNHAKRFHELYYDNTKNFLWLKNKNFFMQMKPSHRNELLNHAFQNIFNKFHSFFDEISKLSSKISIITNFKTSIQVKTTEIIKEGKEVHKIYFIERGKIDLIYKNRKIKTLNEGEIFGLEGIIKNYNKSEIEYKVSEYCGHVILFTINIKLLIQEILNYDGDSFSNLSKIAKAYLHENLKLGNELNNKIIDEEINKPINEDENENENENDNIDIITSSNNDLNNEEENNNKNDENYNIINSGRLAELNITCEQLEKAKHLIDESDIRLALIDKQINFINNYFSKIKNKNDAQ